MTLSHFTRSYWRVLTVAVLGAVLAFAGSFLKETTYTSDTRLLIRGRDASFLTSKAQDLAGQPGVVDASLSQSLAATYAAIATSRSVAEDVVGVTALDQRPESTGPVAAVARGLAWVYRCSRAVLTSGFCAEVDPHAKAVTYVQEGTRAASLGVNAGAAAGTSGSYVLEITSSGRTAEEARAVTDAVADALVRTSNARFKGDSATYIGNLEEQLRAAEADVATRGAALAAYQTEHGVAAADGKQALSASTYESIRQEYLRAKADQSDTKAQLASISASLNAVPASQRSTQRIVTGRSTTSLDTDSANSVYNDLLTRRETLQAEYDGATARVTALQAQLDAAAPLSGNAAQAQLATMQKSVDLAEANRTSVSVALQQARVSAASGGVELTRLDSAAAPAYPSEPKRYIFLALGLLLGALAGWWLTMWQRPARLAPAGGAPDGSDPVGVDVDDLDSAGSDPAGRGPGDGDLAGDDDPPLLEPFEPEPATAAAGRGNGSRAPARRRSSGERP